MRLFGLAGWSGSGKTTLLSQLVPALRARGITVSTVKHAHHGFDLDQPGKDSWRHREAGAAEVMIASERRWALIHEHRGSPEPPLEALVQHMTPVDLVLAEGFKRAHYPKIEVHRPALGKPLLCREDRHIVAVASDALIGSLALPLLQLADVAGIATFILRYCGLERRDDAAQ